MRTKAYIKPEADLAKREKLEPLYDACKAIWKTTTEMNMIRASAKIRSKPGWEDELDNKAIREQWIAEIKSKQELNDKQASYVIEELFYYAKLQAAARSCGGDAKLSVVDMLWYTDIPENSDLAQEFNSSLSKMTETMPISHYYRPAGYQYDLFEHIVDPSLYSLVYESTPILPKPMTSPKDALHLPSFDTVPGSIDGWRQAVRDLNASMAEKDKGNDSEQSEAAAASFVPFNERYLELTDPSVRHWLPTDIYVNQDGSVDFRSYINNIHPEEHADMYVSISKIISKAIPLLEQALTDWEHSRDLRIPYDYYNCLGFSTEHPAKLGGKFDVYSEEFDENAYDEAVDKWKSSMVNTTPDPEEFVEPKRPLVPYSLRNRNLQVVIEITDKYTSVFNTASENIIATAVYYYDTSHKSPPSIEFLEAIESDFDSFVDAYDHLAYKALFRAETDLQGESYIQSAGCVGAKQGRLICYPNVYEQERYLIGERLRRLTIYFVDPSVRIVSTAIVPPQQKDWWTKAASPVPLPVSVLPLEIHGTMCKYIESLVSFDKACKIFENPNGVSSVRYDKQKFFCGVYIGYMNCSDIEVIQSFLTRKTPNSKLITFIISSSSINI